MVNKITWGIIGCGDVTEVKSGPAFNKVENSSLIAVMRRNAAKAEDYARRHHVPKWYNNADDLINDTEINAIYIATPPASHEEYAIKALKAGKNVYVEKPMSLSEAGCLRMLAVAKETGSKLSVAHYRRAMPFFEKIKQLIESEIIGTINCVNLRMMQGTENAIITQTEDNWRLNPVLSGGGLFHDLAPHQIDMIFYLFGNIKQAVGLATNKGKQSEAHDMVAGQILFDSDVLFNGLWCFNNPVTENLDLCELIGTKGKISFAFFGQTKISINLGGKEEVVEVLHPTHVQQPMIEKVVKYFLDEEDNPCTGADGTEVLRIMDLFAN
jgi:predicted dehydrogenase